MLQAYRQHSAERAALGIPPLPLSAQQVDELIALIKNPPAGDLLALDNSFGFGGHNVALAFRTV